MLSLIIFATAVAYTGTSLRTGMSDGAEPGAFLRHSAAELASAERGSGTRGGAEAARYNDREKPDCSSCRDAAPDKLNGTGDDSQCCVGLPTEMGFCSEFLPESVRKYIDAETNSDNITKSWRFFDKHRSIKCDEYNKAMGKCDPCKGDGILAAPHSTLYCEPSGRIGSLKCHNRTDTTYQIKCHPKPETNWYGGWDVVDFVSYAGNFSELTCDERDVDSNDEPGDDDAAADDDD